METETEILRETQRHRGKGGRGRESQREDGNRQMDTESQRY